MIDIKIECLECGRKKTMRYHGTQYVEFTCSNHNRCKHKVQDNWIYAYLEMSERMKSRPENGK